MRALIFWHPSINGEGDGDGDGDGDGGGGGDGDGACSRLAL